MNGTLHITVEKHLFGAEAHQGVYAQIFSPSQPSTAVMLPIGMQVSPRMIDIPEGPYFIQAELPSGHMIEHHGVIGGGDSAEIRLRAGDSAHEWLSWYSFTRDANARHAAGWEQRPKIDQILGGAPQVEFWDAPDHPTGTNLTPAHFDHDPHALSWRFTDAHSPSNLSYFVVAAPTFRSTVFSLPIPWRSPGEEPIPVQIVMSSPETDDPDSAIAAGPRTEVIVEDPAFAGTLAYLRSGNRRAAKMMSQTVAETAEQMLYNKVTNPFGAAAGGLILLQLGEDARLHDWPRNLANWMDWLPDGPVILGWQLLRSAKVGTARAEAREAFLDAASRGGPPVFTESLRLLIAGLRVFATKRDHPGTPEETVVDAALSEMTRFAAVADPNAIFTTFTGLTPTDPDPAIQPGIAQPGGAGQKVLEPV